MNLPVRKTLGWYKTCSSANDVMKSEQFMNLKVHRSEAQGWKRGAWRRYVDDGAVMRLASLAGAGLLACGLYSARRRTASSLWWIVGGASLLGCAAAGKRHALRSVRSSQDLAAADVVTRESLDSFPASDAPSSNATTVSPQPLPSLTR
jgi:hypothetical protein